MPLRNFGEVLPVYKALHPKVTAVRTSNATNKISDLSIIEHVSAIRNQSLYRQGKLISNNSAL